MNSQHLYEGKRVIRVNGVDESRVKKSADVTVVGSHTSSSCRQKIQHKSQKDIKTCSIRKNIFDLGSTSW